MKGDVEVKGIEEVIGNDFSGVISISKAGKSVFKKAYGYADLPNKRLNNIKTKFGTASAGKAFVATAIIKLIEDGRLSLESKIGELLDFDLKDICKTITIAQLLNHTSGIPDYCDESVVKEYAELWVDFPNYRIRSSSDIIPLFINKPMMHEPGERFQYNNTGYVVLGLVIEKVTGIPFDSFLSKVIFTPCEMKNTGYYELDRLPENCANAYILDKKNNDYYTNIYCIDAKGTGAGGAFTTVDDIDDFWTHLKNGDIVHKSIVSEMLSPKVGTNEYGYGFWISPVNIPYFQGSDPGVSFISSCDDEGLIISLVSNIGDNVWRIHRELRRLMVMEVLEKH